MAMYLAITSIPYCVDLDIYCEHNIPGQNAKHQKTLRPCLILKLQLRFHAILGHINRKLYPLMNNLNKG